MRIDIIGAGALGTALAIHTCKNINLQTIMWTKEDVQAKTINNSRTNQKFLPNYLLPNNLITKSLTKHNAWQEIGNLSDLVIITTPMAALRQILTSLTNTTSKPLHTVWASKGFEMAQANPNTFGLMAHEIQQQIAPNLITGVISGPSFAQEIANGTPCAIVAASNNANLCSILVDTFHHNNIRIYPSNDVVGVEVGGAVKNVLAIAAGVCQGLELGHNALAALITRGLAEMARFGTALGAKLETFMGLSGLGDLVLTTTGDLSRNRQVGILLAKGNSVTQAVNSLGHVAEGVYSAKTVVQRANLLQIDMPIAQLVVQLIDNKISAKQALTTLMSLPAKAENII